MYFSILGRARYNTVLYKKSNQEIYEMLKKELKM